MFLNAVILILQETLEAALLLSILAALALHTRASLRWLPAGLGGGAVLALLYALNLEAITAGFDYIGQELLNATLQGVLAISIWGVALATGVREPAKPTRHDTARRRGFAIAAALALCCAIAREGSEIFVYLQGFLGQDHWPESVMTGSFIGFCIGASTGLLLFYGLWSLRPPLAVRLDLALLAMFAGNMLSQAVQQLEQASVLPSTAMAWNSNGLIREDSVVGQLLYALVGYESTPSILQVTGYAIGVAGVGAAVLLGRRIQHDQEVAA